ncbi:endonuclease III [gut metagenome]|uniref:Endonuclease III n=1 Tax=gut metagenome TaxID=749906 RepID=J9GHZ9_9ZZZZ
MFNPTDSEAFMAALAAERPDPQSDLHWSTPFELLVAVVLSAQATDKGVNLATAKLFPVANTPAAVAALGIEGLTPYIQTIGLYKSKAKHVIALSEILRDRYHGEVPRRFEELIELPGVGRKTANVVLNVAFGEPRIAVDTHIFRVCNRTGFAPGKTPIEVENQLMKVVPAAYLKNAHHWILLHGRYCCKARNPACERCPVANFCRAPEKAARLEGVGKD